MIVVVLADTHAPRRWKSCPPAVAAHLRRADRYDEDGRGLMLVAQLAERWGTRYTGTGKIIWAEQPLPA